MGEPVINARCARMHEDMTACGFVGKRIPRADVEGVIMRRLGVGMDAARRYLETGRRLRLWDVTDGRSKRGAFVICRAPRGSA